MFCSWLLGFCVVLSECSGWECMCERQQNCLWMFIILFGVPVWCCQRVWMQRMGARVRAPTE